MGKDIIASGELYHYGVKGMKWGVRRYQNKDGTLTDAGRKRLVKDLKKDYKRNYDSSMPFKTSGGYKKKLSDSISKVVTNDDKKRIEDAKNKWLDKLKESDKAEQALDELAEKYGRDYYDDEIRRNPDLYDTPRSKQKLSEYATYDYGYDKAREARPDLDKASRAADPYRDLYREECRRISDKILGEYGDTKLYECKYYSLSIRDTVGNMVSSMESNKWKL